MLDELNPEKALVFRITHRDNLPWIVANGIHCRRSQIHDPNFVAIGLADLIDKRHVQRVLCAPGGTLSNYIPFYFTPLSPMALRIKSGHNVRQRSNNEIIIAVSSLRKLEEDGVKFLFTDKHASTIDARFSSDLKDLDRIDWKILKNRDFSRDSEDLGKTDRYQAEALIRDVVPVNSLICVVTYDNDTKKWAEQIVATHHANLKVVQKPGWYF